MRRGSVSRSAKTFCRYWLRRGEEYRGPCVEPEPTGKLRLQLLKQRSYPGAVLPNNVGFLGQVDKDTVPLACDHFERQVELVAAIAA